DVLFRDHRVVQGVSLVVELDDGARQDSAFLETKARSERAGSDIADHDLERDDFHFLDQLLTHVEAADEVGRDTDPIQVLEDVLGNSVVENTLAVNDLVLLRVERSRVVLEKLDE